MSNITDQINQERLTRLNKLEAENAELRQHIYRLEQLASERRQTIEHNTEVLASYRRQLTEAQDQITELWKQIQGGYSEGLT